MLGTWVIRRNRLRHTMQSTIGRKLRVGRTSRSKIGHKSQPRPKRSTILATHREFAREPFSKPITPSLDKPLKSGCKPDRAQCSRGYGRPTICRPTGNHGRWPLDRLHRSFNHESRHRHVVNCQDRTRKLREQLHQVGTIGLRLLTGAHRINTVHRTGTINSIPRPPLPANGHTRTVPRTPTGCQ